MVVMIVVYVVSLLALTKWYMIRLDKVNGRYIGALSSLRKTSEALSYYMECHKSYAQAAQELDTVREFPAASVAELD